MILVTGATGTVGSQVVKQLRAANAPFKVYARDIQKATAIAGPDVKIAQGEYRDRQALDKALAGVDHLFLLAPSGPGSVETEMGIADAAAAAGVSHIVKLSVLGASPLTPIKIDQWHWYSEKYIEKLGIPFTFVRPTFFMQNLLMYAATAASEGVIYMPLGNGAVSMIDARDIATVSVAALTWEGHLGKVYEITGPEAITMNDVAESIGSAIGKEVRYINVTPDQARGSMLGSGMPEWLVDDMLTYTQFFREGAGALVTPVVERIKGSSPIAFDQFARDYAAAFAGE